MLQAETASTQSGDWRRSEWAPTRAARLDKGVGKVAEPSRARSGETATIVPFPARCLRQIRHPRSSRNRGLLPGTSCRQSCSRTWLCLTVGTAMRRPSVSGRDNGCLPLSRQAAGRRSPSLPRLGPDGEVGLYRHPSEGLAEVSFYGDGGYSYHAECTPAAGQPVTVGKGGCPLRKTGTGIVACVG